MSNHPPQRPSARRPGEPDFDHDAAHVHDGCGSGCGHDHGHDHADDAEPMFVFSRESIREVDRLAVQEFGIPSIVLMENAARGLRNAVLELLEPLEISVGEVDEDEDDKPQESVLIVCGAGNNGGDGLALARHLSNDGLPIAIVLAAADSVFEGDAATNLKIIRNMKLPIARSVDEGLNLLAQAVSEVDETFDPEEWSGPTVVVDALLGTGLSTPVRGEVATVIAAINRLGEGTSRGRSIILSADVPSGLDAQTGEPLGPESAPAVRADMTVTFVGLKAGFLNMDSQPYMGEVVVVDIGSPIELTLRLGLLLEEAQHPGEDDV